MRRTEPVELRLDFATEFDVEVAPPFPADGRWRVPVFTFQQSGRVEPSIPSWGSPLVVRFGREGRSWIGAFPGGRPGVSGIYSGPGPGHFVVVYEGASYFFDAGQPEAGLLRKVQPRDWVWQVHIALNVGLILLASSTELVAISRDGLAWRSGRLCIDGLIIKDVAGAAITCFAENMSDPEEIVVDPATGLQIAGYRLPAEWK